MSNRNLSQSGIYAIIHKASGKLYVGSAVSIRRRWSQHKLHLNAGRHHSRLLQRAWNKYGKDDFVFVVVQFCDRQSLIAIEQKWIDECEASGTRGYNSSATAGSNLGVRHSEAAKAKRRAMLADPDVKSRLKAALRAAWADPVSRAERVAAAKAGHANPDVKAKISAAAKKRNEDPAYRLKQSVAQKLRNLDPELRANKSAATKAAWANTDMRAKVSAAATGKKLSQESIAKRTATRRANKIARMSMVQGKLFS